MTDQDTDLTSEERGRLRALRDVPAPPDELEKRTIENLYRSGTLRHPAKRARGRLIRVAAAAAIFTVGLLLGSVISRPLEPRYVLLLVDRGGTATSSDEDARVSEYAEWARRVRADGVGISGARLANDLELVGTPTGESAVSGFFLIDVEDGDRALEIARSCPHTRYGGSIVLGRILP